MKYDDKNKDGKRLCSACGEWKEKPEFGLQKVRMKNGTIWTGLRPECKECRNKSIRAGRRLKRNRRLQ